MGLFSAIFAQAQTTVTFKPGPVVGKEASVLTSTGPCSWWNNGVDSDQVNILAVTWTYSSMGCGEGTTRSLIKFSELANIPTNATVTSATLKLYGVSSSPHTAGNAGNNECILARATGSWAENTVTWNSQPTYTSANQVIIPAGGSTWNWNFTNNSANLVAMVQYMISNPAQNYGFIMKLQSENTYNSLVFASSDHPDSTLWPELTVTYTVPGSTSALNVDQSINLNIYPNPTTDIVHISVEGLSTQKGKLTLTNAIGQTVYATTMSGNDHSLNTASLPSGIYTLIYSSEKGSRVEKVAIRH